MAEAEKPPIRITKQRAQAFLDVVSRGIEVRIAEIKDRHGIVVHLDGSVEGDSDAFDLLEPTDRLEVAEQVEALVRAIDTAAIFRRRYG